MAYVLLMNDNPSIAEPKRNAVRRTIMVSFETEMQYEEGQAEVMRFNTKMDKVHSGNGTAIPVQAWQPDFRKSHSGFKPVKSCMVVQQAPPAQELLICKHFQMSLCYYRSRWAMS